MTVGDRIRWWIAGAAIIGVLLWILRESLAPFLFGAAIAYFLDPAVDWLETRRIRRSFGAAFAMAMALVAAAIALLLLLPILIEQATSLVDQVPGLIERLRVRFVEIARSGAAGVVGGAVLTDLLESLREPGLQAGAQALKGALAGGIAAADFLSFAVITPVVAFYMLVDWDRIVAHIGRLIPRDQVETVRRLARDVDEVLGAFARGQVLVCLGLATFYSLALLSAGLDHAVAIGVLSGLVSFVPYVGTAVGFVLSVGVALFQFWPEALPIMLVAAVFVAGQLLESYVLTPRLVGRQVGLHPVWLLFALLAGGNLFGFSGLLVAVPAAAAIGVLVRFGEARYRDGRFYLGGQGTDEGPKAEDKPKRPG